MEYDKKYIIKLTIKVVTAAAFAADMVYFVLSAQPASILFVPLNIVAIAAQFYNLKPSRFVVYKTHTRLFEKYSLSDDGIEYGAPLIQQIPQKNWDTETLFGPNNTQFWVYMIMRVEDYMYDFYVLDPHAPYKGTSILIDALRVETRGIPQRRTYEKLKLAYTEDLLDIVDKARKRGLNENNMGLLLTSSKPKREKNFQKIVDDDSVATMKN